MAKRGRPSKYTKKLADEICRRIAEGEHLRGICADEGMPSPGTVCDWNIRNEGGFSERYARAQEIKLQIIAEEILELSDVARLGVKTKVKKIGRKVAERETVTGDMVERSKLQIDTRKWVLSKLVRNKYGDGTESSGGDGAKPNRLDELTAVIKQARTDAGAH